MGEIGQDKRGDKMNEHHITLSLKDGTPETPEAREWLDRCEEIINKEITVDMLQEATSMCYHDMAVYGQVNVTEIAGKVFGRG